jgi:hypothetical protein
MKVTSFHVVTISIFKALYHQYGIISYNHEWLVLHCFLYKTRVMNSQGWNNFPVHKKQVAESDFQTRSAWFWSPGFHLLHLLSTSINIIS